jgi:hypothetical protein
MRAWFSQDVRHAGPPVQMVIVQGDDTVLTRLALEALVLAD